MKWTAVMGVFTTHPNKAGPDGPGHVVSRGLVWVTREKSSRECLITFRTFIGFFIEGAK